MSQELKDYAYNVLTSSFGRAAGAGPSPDLMAYIEANEAWADGMVSANAQADDYWLAIGMLRAQMEGLLVGYNVHSACSAVTGFEPMAHLDLLLVNLDGDLFDLVSAYPGGSTNATAAGGPPAAAGELLPLRHHKWPAKTATAEATEGQHGGGGGGGGGFEPLAQHPELRCSALFKVAADGSDVFFGHDTWDTYATAAPRTFKTVRLCLYSVFFLCDASFVYFLI